MSEDLDRLRAETITSLSQAADLRGWDAVRVGVLGKSGALTGLLKELGKLAPDERKARGAALNVLRDELTQAIEARRLVLEEEALAARLAAEMIDVTLPARPIPQGAIHPISRTMEEMAAIFGAMGFQVNEGRDIENDWFNFGALNIPGHHPARADHDTFYLPGEFEGRPRLLRTQTSDVQIHTMLNQEPPIRVIAPGRTYRADHDATHSPMFHQCEGLVIDRGITLAHLKGCLTDFMRAFFGIEDLPVRFRSSFFPFTEPSMEMDIGCNRKTGELGGSDWLEVLGCGMVHPKVLANCGLDPREWQGFAFGLGIDRFTMLKHGIPDLRAFFDGDPRWAAHYGFNPLAPANLIEGI
jgi:phenylalanyl-tRNA synthetase alpha chain